MGPREQQPSSILDELGAGVAFVLLLVGAFLALHL